jgi:hypothetical protein
LLFEVPALGGCNRLAFQTHGEISGIEVGYDVSQDDLLELDFPESVDDFLDMFCPLKSVELLVDKAAHWSSQLQLGAKNLYIQFVPTRAFGGGFVGRGVTGRRNRGLLQLEFSLAVDGHLTFEDPFDGAEWGDVIPHELMHIKDVIDGRCPSIFPYQMDCGWVDFFRHLWIDGHLERLGAPHARKETRVAELSGALLRLGTVLPGDRLAEFSENWWGKPMNMREAIRLGLNFGFSLAEGGPLDSWFRK